MAKGEKVKKVVSPQKIIIEGDFVDFKSNGTHRMLTKGVTYNVTAEKARLFIKAGWGELI